MLLSFLLPGLGQIYNGEIGKGIAFIIAYGFSSVLLVVMISFMIQPMTWVLVPWPISKIDPSLLTVLIGLLLAPTLGIWGMLDAYRKAEELNTME